MKTKTVAELLAEEWWWRRPNELFRWNEKRSETDPAGLKYFPMSLKRPDGTVERPEFDATTFWRGAGKEAGAHFYELARRGDPRLMGLPPWDKLNWSEESALSLFAKQKAQQAGKEYVVCKAYHAAGFKRTPGFTTFDTFEWNLSASPTQLAEKFCELMAARAKEAGLKPRRGVEKNSNRKLSWRGIEVLDLHSHGLKSHPNYNSGQRSSELKKAKMAATEFLKLVAEKRSELPDAKLWVGLTL